MNAATISKVMAQMGAKGGHARKRNLSVEELRAIAQKAGKASVVARRKAKEAQ